MLFLSSQIPLLSDSQNQKKKKKKNPLLSPIDMHVYHTSNWD